METKRDISKLPKWAQELIDGQRRLFHSAKAKTVAMQDENEELKEKLARKKSLERVADLDRRILSQVNVALGKAITDELTGYQKPLSKIVERVINSHSSEVYNLVNDEFVTLLTADDFRSTLKTALNDKLARVLISRMGGELEKQVNELKANPQTRALITLAISGVVAELIQGEIS